MKQYSYEHIHNVINDTANDIIDVAKLPETGVVDALNFLVSATLMRLNNPKLNLKKVAQSYGLVNHETAKPLSGGKALENIIGWMHE